MSDTTKPFPVTSPAFSVAHEQLNGIAALPQNWDGEGSCATLPVVVEAARRVLYLIQGMGALSAPHIVPISGGTLQFEWRDEQRYAEIEFSDNNKIACLLRTGPHVNVSMFSLDDDRMTVSVLRLIVPHRQWQGSR